MKTQEEIEQLAQQWFLNDNSLAYGEEFGFIQGYIQCQKDNDWKKNCECESSIGQTWCCNQCGLPYDTRKSDKKYTLRDIEKAFLEGCASERKFSRRIDDLDKYIISLNKQD